MGRTDRPTRCSGFPELYQRSHGGALRSGLLCRARLRAKSERNALSCATTGDAPRTVPRRSKLHVWWSDTRSREPQLKRGWDGERRYGTMPAVIERGMRLPSASVMDHDRPTDQRIGHCAAQSDSFLNACLAYNLSAPKCSGVNASRLLR